LGSLRAKSRSTRSGAEARAGSRVVVRGPARRPEAPKIPRARMIRATRFVPTDTPWPRRSLSVDTRRTVDPEGLVVDLCDLGRKCLIGDRASARRA
jgi:hypothetical protein